MKTVSFLKTLALAALVGANFAKATPIYDNLGAISGGADPIGTFGPLYDSFTSSSTVALSSLELALSGNNDSGTLTVGLYSDSSTTPGGLITTLGTIDDSTIGIGINDYTVSLDATPVVTAGTRYWIGLSDSDLSSNDASWAWSTDVSGPGVSGEFFSNHNGTFSNSEGPYQMDLNGGSSAAPDISGAASLFALGIAGILVLRRKTALI